MECTNKLNHVIIKGIYRYICNYIHIVYGTAVKDFTDIFTPKAQGSQVQGMGTRTQTAELCLQ